MGTVGDSGSIASPVPRSRSGQRTRRRLAGDFESEYPIDSYDFSCEPELAPMEVLRLASASSVMNYFVLDLETANGNCASICQLGIVTVEDGIVVGPAPPFINPEAAFDPWNIRIHGIGPEHVRGQPTWPELFIQVAPRLTGSIVVTHGPFDRVAITRACERYGLGTTSTRWLDNQRVVRRTWPNFAKKGYALDNRARHFGIPLRHHDALED